ncbi:MerR family transcriptional regulator [Sphingomonas sp. NBWT7]|uniref:MerR family transcriptional regulator n=1 Tax=Sphingomonas sp. NBWT7 TaxID=2596913 RepID=UPI0016285230|nr:MerR family transcriptional regulator [Sphingomonas sp. NBWT7]QNE33039.1 MerR family transcriptional regulator [Sphingomonas sp. NBWT7]
MTDTGKAPGAFRTIGEVTAQTGVAAHVLRYWETRFPQLRPVTRAGNRRYYRPEDVALVERIHRLLDTEGYTVKGVQKLLAGEGRSAPSPLATPTPVSTADTAAVPVEALIAIRDRLQRALDA